jgi:hypothetical protein
LAASTATSATSLMTGLAPRYSKHFFTQEEPGSPPGFFVPVCVHFRTTVQH